VWIILTFVLQAKRVCPGSIRGKGDREYRVAVQLQVRYVPFNFARSVCVCVYIVINGVPVELNNSDCAKCR